MIKQCEIPSLVCLLWCYQTNLIFHENQGKVVSQKNLIKIQRT